MMKYIVTLAAIVSLAGTYTYAANGDLIANGNANIGGNATITGNLGVGTSTPGQKLSVAGTIESTSGGIKFPDGTTQTTAGANVLASYPTSGYFNVKDGIIDWGAGDSDTRAATTPGAAWKYTIPLEGYYAIDAMVSFMPNVANITYTWWAKVYKNGALFKAFTVNGSGANVAASLNIIHVPIRGIWHFNQGDYIDIRAYNDYTPANTYYHGDYLTIQRVN